MQTPDVTETAAPSVAQTLAKFGADDQRGLSDTEVQARLKKYGPNAPVEKQTNAFAALLQYFWGPMPGMIEAAALTALIVGDWGRFCDCHLTAVVQRSAGVLGGTRSLQMPSTL
jgi:H+-transporting ATPase